MNIEQGILKFNRDENWKHEKQSLKKDSLFAIIQNSNTPLKYMYMQIKVD